ncbi:MAG: 30S ribosomal protein S16 [Candidatus Margulisiibacteriota bacterium]
MAAKIKLQRKGAKNQPFYRVVVQDESAARDGRVIEVLGQYNPLVEPSLFKVDKEKTLSWISKGAQPTEKVRILLGKAGILPPVDLASLPKRKPRAGEKAEKPPEEKPKEKAKGGEKKEEKAKPLDEARGKEEQS